MKVKYLFPVLAGLAFSACSQDESLLNTDVQKGNYSPITFSVSKEGVDGAETRAWEELTGSPYFKFETGDLLSLWNGMKWASGSNKWNPLGQNAVFEGEGEGESLVFKTRSLVNEGAAILVYPADTTFQNTGSELKVFVDNEQDAKTKQFLPYISDVMNIEAYDETGADNTAGYGRNYDVLLRPVGTLFAMNLKPTTEVDFEALGVAPIKFNSVTLDNNSTNIFATSAKITQGTTTSNLPTVDVVKYAHFKNFSDVTVTEKVSAISTTDIADNKTAYFTLLPYTESNATFDGASKIVVTTTYGSVTITNNAAAEPTDKGPLQNIAGTNGINLAANLANVLNNTWGVREDSKFGTENQGRVIKRTLTLDLSTLDMDQTVVTTSQQLIDLLKVYDALEIEDAITLQLDGETADDASFVMTKAALDALKKYNATGTDITLDIATLSNNTLTLAEGATLEALNDASVVFSNNTDNTIVLTEDATLDQAFESTKLSNITSNAVLTYTNEEAENDEPAYTLTVNGSIKFNGTKFVTGELTTNAGSQMTIAAGQTVTFSNTTALYGDVDNNGIMSAAAGVTNYGYIDNKFEVSVLSGNVDNKFTNVGEIFNNGNMAVTYITENGNGTNSGRIILTNRNDEVSLNSGATYEGYIVYTMKDAVNGKYTYTRQSNDVFNWLIVETTGIGASVEINSNVDYLEVKGNAVNVTADGISVTDLFVNTSMRLLGNNTLTAENIYVNDYILHAGGLTGTQKTSYTSNVYGETEDRITYANGEIRTVAGGTE